jgi:hypothetical protein
MTKFFANFSFAILLFSLSPLSLAADWSRIIAEGTQEQMIEYKKTLIEKRTAVTNPRAVQYNGKFVLLIGPYSDDRVNQIRQNYINKGLDPNQLAFFQLNSQPKELASPNNSVPRPSNSPADQSQNSELATRLAKCAGSYKFAAIVAGPNDPNSATLTGTSNISMNVANILTKTPPAQLKQIRDNEVAILTSEFEKVANTNDRQRILAWSNSIGAKNNACTAFITPLAQKIQQDINNSK